MKTKLEFFSYMSELFQEEYSDNEGYKTYKEILSLNNKGQIKEMKKLIVMDQRERLLYRHALASNGKELTPRQLDQYLTIIEYALDNRE